MIVGEIGMAKKVRFACPMDCFDLCGLIATVSDGRVTRIQGDRKHPVTRGRVCVKGKKLLERLYHPERLKTPLKRHGEKWAALSWDDALAQIAEKLNRIKRNYGSEAVLHYSDSGYGGIVKSVDRMFFNHFGGVTVPKGSLCWAAGIAAQKYDFGEARGHHPEDIARAGTILLWSRNPVYTNMHLVGFINQARKNGATVILIDPMKSASANIADTHISVNPGSDGVLALGMCKIVLDNGWEDTAFINSHVLGFKAFRDYLTGISLEEVRRITGIEGARLDRLTEKYARKRPSAIVVGYGLQRYANSGNTIRCIDALGAITGNIGISGGGVNYANRFMAQFIKGELAKSEGAVSKRRVFSLPRFSEFLETAGDPPVKGIFITKANPLVQMPDTNRAKAAFAGIDFKVVIDMFMTDTARHADIVLPCTSILEEEDIVVTSMFSPCLNYSHRAVSPPAGIIGEYDFFRQLAKTMGLDSYPDIDRVTFLKRAVKPLEEQFGIKWDRIREHPITLPGNRVPWKDHQFLTPSGKYELYSQKAAADGFSPIPVFSGPSKPPAAYPLRLLTPHARQSMHSQHFAFTDRVPVAYLCNRSLETFRLKAGKKALLSSKTGSLKVRVAADDGVHPDTVVVFQGWWNKSGSVNVLTEIRVSDMGNNAAYNECFCRISGVDT
jgi:anaerobic selenocysteine-containing dehydrogenase